MMPAQFDSKWVSFRSVMLFSALAFGIGGLTRSAVASADVIRQISVGGSHVCAITMSDSVLCWGDNSSGQLGDGSSIDAAVPLPVQRLNGKPLELASGKLQTCVLLRGGAVSCWGYDRSGAAARSVPKPVLGLSGRAIRIASGAAHSCALVEGGTVQCWGLNDFGQIGDGTRADSLQAVPVVGLKGKVKAIAGGAAHTCATLKSGEVECWGADGSGQLGSGSVSESRSKPVSAGGASLRALSVSAGGSNSCAVLVGWTVDCWGSNERGQIGVGSSGPSVLVPTAVQGLPGEVLEVAVGEQDHACAVIRGGSIACWGSNESGKLGDGLTADSSLPTLVKGLSGPAIHVSSGGNHTCALLSVGTVECWGADSDGELGTGATTPSPTAVSVRGLKALEVPVIAVVPPRVTNSTTAKITFETAPRGAESSCSLDGLPFTACTQSVVLKSLRAGHHQLRVRFSLPGGVASIAAVADWTVDLSAPTIETRPLKPIRKTRSSVTFMLSASSDPSGIGLVEYSPLARPRPNSRPVASRTIKFSTPLNIATTSVVRWLRVQDRAGNWSRWYAVR